MVSRGTFFAYEFVSNKIILTFALPKWIIMFSFNKDKSIHSVFFILNEIEEGCDIHKVCKILYFADQKHLVKWGRPITGDHYIKMNYGPVPSNIKNIIDFSSDIQRNGNILSTVVEYDSDELSVSEINCLKESIEENRKLNFNELTEKSHDKAWNKAELNNQKGISYIEMAKVITTDENMLNYIRANELTDQIHF